PRAGSWSPPGPPSSSRSPSSSTGGTPAGSDKASGYRVLGPISWTDMDATDGRRLPAQAGGAGRQRWGPGWRRYLRPSLPPPLPAVRRPRRDEVLPRRRRGLRLGHPRRLRRVLAGHGGTGHGGGPGRADDLAAKLDPLRRARRAVRGRGAVRARRGVRYVRLP